MHSKLAYGLKWIAAPALALLLGACGDASVGDLFDEPEAPAPMIDAESGDEPDTGPPMMVSDADVSDADVSDADVSDADVSDADVSDADVSDADSPEVDPSDAQTVPVPGCGLAITSLTNGQVLTAADDNDSSCGNGLQHTLVVSTPASDGTQLTLQVNGADIATAMVSGGAAQFEDVDVPLGDIVDVEVVLDASCSAMVAVQASCPVTPSCEITSPVDGAVLSGVLTAFGGDRTGSGLGFTTSVTVQTDLADGETVLLNTVGGVTLTGEVAGGEVEFPTVTLDPDGSYELFATCVGDVETDSASVTVTVDATPPEIITGDVSPADGQSFSVGDDVNTDTAVIDYEVCVPVSSADALDVGDNVCVTVVGDDASRVCAPAVAGGADGGADGACLTLQCPGSAAYSLDVIVTDGVGNSSATHTIGGLICASNLPSVQIASIVDTPAESTDISRRLLNAVTPGAVLVDEDPATAGAQHTLVACSNAEGGQARALAGADGGALTEIAGFVDLVADTADACPADLPFVAVFPGVTVPESALDAAGELATRTVVTAEVVSASMVSNQASPTGLWVDTTLPELTLEDPTRAALCDSVTPMTSLDITLGSTAYPAPAELTVTNAGTVDATYQFVDAIAQTVSLPAGSNVITATTTEPSGNQAALAPCAVQVGAQPTVSWVMPAPATTILNAASAPAGTANAVSDADAVAAGWQGTLTVTVADLLAGDVAAGQVQFFLDGVALGAAILLADGVGDATTRTVSLDLVADGLAISDALSAVLTATVSGTVNGDGTADLGPLLVDTVRPVVPANPQVVVGPNPEDRRHTRFEFTWQAAGDGAGGAQTVDGYEVVATADVVNNRLSFEAAYAVEPIVPTTTPLAPGGAESLIIENRNIETLYYFALRSRDAAGNVSVVAPVQTETARLRTLEILPPDGFGIDDAACTNSGEDCLLQFGASFDGSTDLNGDSLSDLVVGTNTGDAVFVYLADAATGTYPATPTTVIRGTQGFGIGVAVIGDFDGDMPAGATPAQEAAAQDIAIVQNFLSDFSEGAMHIVSGRDWAAVSEIDISSVDLQPAAAGLAASETALAALGVYTIRANGFPNTVARVGNFDGDIAGAEDLVFGRSVGPGAVFDGAVIALHGGAPIGRLVDLEDASLDARRREYQAPAGGNLEFGAELVGVGPLFANGFLAGNSATNLVTPGAAGYQWAVAGEAATGVQILDTADTAAVPQVTGSGSDALGLSGVQLLGGQGYVITRAAHVLPGITPARRGEVDVYLGAGVDRLNAAPNVTLRDTATTNNFGQVVVGTGYSGRPASYSTPLLGDSGNPDIVVASASYFQPPAFAVEEPPLLRIIRGDALPELSGTVDLAISGASATVRTSQLETPISFGGNFDAWSEAFGGTIRDMNGDGFAEIVLVERRPDTGRGRLIILY